MLTPKHAIQVNLKWKGWLRCRGLFFPYIEIGLYGSQLPERWQVPLVAHERKHMMGRHKMRQVVTWMLVAGFLFWALMRLFGDGEQATVWIPVVSILCAQVAALMVLRANERAADRYAARECGFAYYEALGAVYRGPMPYQVLIYDSHDTRLARIRPICEAAEREFIAERRIAKRLEKQVRKRSQRGDSD